MVKHNKIFLKNVLIVTFLLVLAFLFRTIGREMSSSFGATVLIILRSLIHVSTIIFWTLSLYKRVVNKQVRQILIGVGVLMTVWLLAKTIKYEFFPNNTTTLARYLWYGYYVPMVMIPFLGIMVTQFIDKPDSYRLPKWTYLFYIPAILLIGGVLTNDLHNFAFSFPKGIEYYDNNYSYGFLYWCAMAWYIVLGLTFVILLIKKNRLQSSKKMQFLPLFIMLGAIVFWLLYTFKVINVDLTVIDCLLIGSLLESALQTGLIQTNTNYRELFEKTTVPVIIVDGYYQARYTSGGAKPVDETIMKDTENGTVVFNNTILSSAPIRAGRVVWQDDVTKLNKQREELDEIRETLSEESVLIRAETEIKEKQAQADEKNRLYDKIAREVKPQLAILNGLLDKIEKGENTKENLARVAVIGTYVKRRGNLLLLGNENGDVSVKEIENALRESLDNLKLLGIEVSLVVLGNSNISIDNALKIYDLYQTVVEKTLDNLTAIFVRFIKTDKGLKLSLSLGVKEDFNQNVLETLSASRQLSVEMEDGDVYVDFVLGGNGK